MASEAYIFSDAYSDAILNDPIACANADYIGGHIYGSSMRNYPLAKAKGKKTINE